MGENKKGFEVRGAGGRHSFPPTDIGYFTLCKT